MTWSAVARKDFEDAVRSRWLWGLSAFFFAFIGGTTAVFFGWILSGSQGQATSDSLFGNPYLSISLVLATVRGLRAFKLRSYDTTTPPVSKTKHDLQLSLEEHQIPHNWRNNEPEQEHEEDEPVLEVERETTTERLLGSHLLEHASLD